MRVFYFSPLGLFSYRSIFNRRHDFSNDGHVYHFFGGDYTRRLYRRAIVERIYSIYRSLYRR